MAEEWQPFLVCRKKKMYKRALSTGVEFIYGMRFGQPVTFIACKKKI